MSINSVVNDTVTSVSVVNALKPLPPTISSYSVGGLDDTALDPAGGQTVQINGTGFLAGATITFDGSAVAVVTYVNPNRLTFTSPAKTAGTYTIYVVNPDSGTAIYIPGIIYSVLPTWTTSAGSLGSYYETTSISNTVVASGDAPITYSLYSGSLPTGSTLYANGVITGTAPVDSSSTTYSFTIQATDAQLQDSTRSFSLTINVDAVTWVSPANNTTYTSAVDSAIANVTLSATDAAGYSVSYSANALPTGLSLSGANISGTPTVIADSSTLLTATAATTNRSAVRTINWSITVANDPYFEYNTLLIPGASTTFVDDASTNNFAVSIFGDTKPNSFNPYTPGYYSNYFDGTGDYLTLPSNAAFGFGTGDFTMECWMYPTSTKTAMRLWEFGGDADNIDISITSTGTISYYNGTTSTTSSAGVISFNSWNHIALVRSSGTAKVYVNGTSQITQATTPNTGARAFYLGGAFNGWFEGYISNMRIVKGTAVYTTTFTPSTTPLTAIANTSLLTCQSNRFIDNSTNNFTITVAGNTSISSFDPFVPNSSYSTYGSGYFDGTGDYLTAPNNAAFNFGTGDFTVECWVYVISFTGSTNVIISTYQDGSNGWTIGITSNIFYGAAAGDTAEVRSSVTPRVNIWTHLALTRSSTTLSLFINGVVAATQTNSTNMSTTSAVTIGTNVGGGALNFTGYITDVRVVKGTAVYTTTFTPPSAPLTAIANTSLLTLQNNQSVNNNVFLDNSTNNFLVTRNGNTTQGTFSPYGGNWSNYFDGTGDYLTTPSSALISNFSGNFTIEGWVYLISTTQFGVLVGGDGTTGWYIEYGTQRGFGAYDGSSFLSGNSSAVTNQWVHFAVSRSSSTVRFFINGALTSSQTSANFKNTQALGIGAYSSGSSFITGYLSNIRINNTTAVYTSAFTPSTTPLTLITGTTLLTCADNRLVDDSINNFTITKNGDVSIQRFSPFNPSSVTPTSYSGYFDGTGDVLTPPANNVFAFGTGSFCIEAWIFNNVLKNYSCLVTTRPNNSNYADAYHIGWDSVGGVSLYVNATSTTGAPAGTITTGQWQHFVCCRDSSNRTAIFVNGTRVGNDTVTSNFTRNLLGIGDFPTTPAEGINGYISNLRLVKGNSVYDPTQTTITVPTSPLTTTSQGVTASTVSILTCQSPTFIDNSTNNFTISAFGNSQPTQQNPFGYTSATTNGYTVSTIGGSGYFDGSGDYLTAPSNAAYQFGTGDFTIEYWIYQTTSGSYRTVLDTRASGTASPWACLINSNNQPYILITSDLFSSIAITINAWNHVAIVRSGTNLSIYVNGVSGLSTTNSTSISPTGSLRVGLTVDNVYPMLGYLTDIRIIKGTAVYKSNFVPPSAPLLALQNTTFLSNMTSAGIIDNTMMNNMETVGDAKLSTAVSKFGGSSMSFDGNGDYMVGSAFSNPIHSIGSGDFTIEMWLYTNANKAQILIDTGTVGGSTTGIQCALNASGYPNTVLNNSIVLTSSILVSTTTWTHVAWVRSSGTLVIYVNGVSGGSVANSINISDTGLTIGTPNDYRDSSSTYHYNGYIDDLRITKSYARYTTTFTPPTTAFPVY